MPQIEICPFAMPGQESPCGSPVNPGPEPRTLTSQNNIGAGLLLLLLLGLIFVTK